MASELRKKTSNALVTILIGFIVISFMFTGYETMRGTPDTVAKVGNEAVKAREYQMEFNRQLNFYKQITGGKNLTTQQIEQFKIKDNTIRNLVNRKLSFILGTKMGVSPSEEEVRIKIKELPYFKSASGQFDINRYKAILQANQLTPSDFEKDILKESVSTDSQAYFDQFPFSNGYIMDLIKFKNMTKTVNLVELNEASLRTHLKVTPKEIKDYLAKEVNIARAENRFSSEKPSLDIKEKVKASHILISNKKKDAKKIANELAKKITKKNFSELARKYTDDPSGKNNGGSLGEFTRGRMVPEFENVAFSQKVGEISKPVKTNFGYHIIYTTGKKKAKEAKFEEHKERIAKDLIQQGKTEELKKLTESVKLLITSALKTEDTKSLEKLQSKYGIKFNKNESISRYDGATSSIVVEKDLLNSIFNGQGKKLFTVNKAGKITFAHLTTGTSKPKELNINEERKGLQTAFGRKVRDVAVDQLRDDIKIKVFSNVIR